MATYTQRFTPEQLQQMWATTNQMGVDPSDPLSPFAGVGGPGYTDASGTKVDTGFNSSTGDWWNPANDSKNFKSSVLGDLAPGLALGGMFLGGAGLGNLFGGGGAMVDPIAGSMPFGESASLAGEGAGTTAGAGAAGGATTGSLPFGESGVLAGQAGGTAAGGTAAAGGTELAGGAAGAFDMTGSAAVPGAAGTAGGIGAGSIFSGGAAGGGGLLGFLGNNLGPADFAKAGIQYMMSGRSSAQLQDYIKQIQNMGSTGVTPAMRAPFQDAAVNAVNNPLTNPFSDSFLKAGQGLIDANVAKSGNTGNTFATQIPQILSGLSGNYNSYLQTLQGFGGYNQNNAPAVSGTTALAPNLTGLNTAQNQGIGDIFGKLSKAAPSFNQIFS